MPIQGQGLETFPTIIKEENNHQSSERNGDIIKGVKSG